MNSMSSSDFKASFMLDRDHLEEFISFLQSEGKALQPSSKYQLARIEINQAKVLVYQSGVIIFEDSERLRNEIRKFFEDRGLENADFEKYQAVELEEDENRGWNETPKGVWLTKQQFSFLRNYLETEYEQEPAQKNEIARFVKNEGQILVLNANGVVYTIGGFDGILQTLRQVIEKNSPYSTYDRIVVIDEQGRWERIGPVAFVIADLMSPDITELQLSGIKDSSKSRNIDHVEFMSTVEEYSTYQTLILTPEEINQEVESRDEYLEFLDNKISEFLSGQILNLNDNTLLVIDETIRESISHDHTLIVDRNDRDTPAIGITSTITNALIDKWRDDWYKKTGIRIDRHNLDQIRDSQYKSQLVKLFL